MWPLILLQISNYFLIFPYPTSKIRLKTNFSFLTVNVFLSNPLLSSPTQKLEPVRSKFLSHRQQVSSQRALS